MPGETSSLSRRTADVGLTRSVMRQALGFSCEKETAMVTNFAGKTALITGAGRGIGRAVALGLADAGAG